MNLTHLVLLGFWKGAGDAGVAPSPGLHSPGFEISIGGVAYYPTEVIVVSGLSLTVGPSATSSSESFIPLSYDKTITNGTQISTEVIT